MHFKRVSYSSNTPTQDDEDSDLRLENSSKRQSAHRNSLVCHADLNTSDICRFLSLIGRLYQKGFVSQKLSRLVVDLCHCVHDIDKMEVREKVEVPLHVAEFLSSFIQFVDRIFKVLDINNINAFSQDEREKSRNSVFFFTRFFTRLSKDFTMQTKIGIQLEKLYFLDVSNSSFK